MENFLQIDRTEILKRFIPIASSAHKGVQGHALIIGGSYGKTGAVCLASKACLKSGAGLVTAYIPKCSYGIIQTAVPEVMAITDDYMEHIVSIHFDLSPQAIGIGIGMGQHPDTQHAFYNFVKANKTALVIDADGLNILSRNKEWLSLLPENTIMTPHAKELERLIGAWDSKEDMIMKTILFSKEFKLIIVVKGAPTYTIDKDMVYENTTGNQALATAGSGDVLTGIITGLAAQGYKPADAAILGVYLHGATADIALPETGHHSFIASDCIAYLGKAFLSLG